MLLPDVSLADHHASVVDAFRGLVLVDDSLQSALHHFVGGEPEHVIELVFVCAEKPVASHSAEEGLALEETPGVVGLEREELSGGLADAGKSELHPPHFSLVLETELADNLHSWLNELIYSLSNLSFSKGFLGVTEVLERFL